MLLDKCNFRSDLPIIGSDNKFKDIYKCNHTTATPNNSTTIVNCNLCSFNTCKNIVELSVWHKMINFSKAVLKYKLAGSPNVTEVVFQKRIDLCESCEFLEKESRRCFKCGCPVEEKAVWATEGCPIGKWQEEIGGDIETTTTRQDMGKQGCGCG